MDYVTQANVYQIIVETLKELGVPNAGVLDHRDNDAGSGRMLRGPEPRVWTCPSHHAFRWRAD